ncbi:aspartate kinase, partial [Methanosarcinales archaeon]
MKEKINKKIVVLKFGGSSVANISRIKLVSRIIIKYKKKGIMPVVVVSAMGDTTDNLINMAKSLNTHPPQRELDLLLSTGEIISAALLAMAIEQQGYKAVALTGPQVGILTDEIHTQAKILSIHPQRIFELLKDDKIVIVAGFQGRTREGEITTLGRGGSDLSAVALAYALNIKDCFIYTDVEGVFTA